MSRSILVTGGTGFLGSHLIRRLLQQDIRVVLLKRSFSNTARITDLLPRIEVYDIDRVDLEAPFLQNEISTIVHCATHYGRKRNDPADVVEANLIFPLKLLQLAEKYGVKTFVNTDTVLEKWISQYSLSKKHFLDWLKFYSDRMNCINMAIEHFYGPGDDDSKFASWVIQSIVKNVPSMDFTEGRQKRDFIYIDDVIDAFTLVLSRMLELGPGFRKLELGTGTSCEVRIFIELVKKLAGDSSTELKFGALPYRPGEIMDSKVDLAPLASLGWAPRWSLADGVRHTIDYERRLLSLNQSS